MYVVERVARGHRYLYLVESVREGKTVRQRTIKALGRKGQYDLVVHEILGHIASAEGAVRAHISFVAMPSWSKRLML